MNQNQLRRLIRPLVVVMRTAPQYTELLEAIYAYFRINEVLLYGPVSAIELDFEAIAENLRGIVFPQPEPIEPEPPLRPIRIL